MVEEAKAPISLPSYPEMIMEAVTVLAEPNGSCKSAISNFIEIKYEDIPAGHSALLAHHLTKLKESGELIFAKNNYMKPDSVATPKRGRGRPRKEKVAVSPGTMPSSPRPRGRPPKPKDQLAVASCKASNGMPRRRGRPPTQKKVSSLLKVDVAVPDVTGIKASDGMPKRRGRPPKPKKASSLLKVNVVTGFKRGRGRPPKAKQPLISAESSLTRSNTDGLDAQG